MTWFVLAEDAEALLATVNRQPGWTYTVLLNGCTSGWGIEVRDENGHLITESWSPPEDRT